MKKFLSKLSVGPVALVCAIGVLAVYPWVTRGYSDLNAYKLGGLFVFTLLCGLAASFVLPEGSRFVRPARPTLWMLAFGASALVSTLLSVSRAASFWGQEGYLGGFVLCLVCLWLYLGLNAWLPAEAPALLLPLLLVSGAGVGLLGVANAFGHDFFSMQTELFESETHIFFSTIGNVDYLNSLFCLWIPVSVWAFLRGETAFVQRLGLGCSAAGCLCLATLDPGISALGFAFAGLLVLVFVPLSGQDFSHLSALLAVWLLVQWAVEARDIRTPLLMLERPFALFGSPLIALPGAAAALALAFALRKASAAPHPRALLVGRVLAGGLLAVLVLLFAAVNLGGVSLGEFNNFFCFGPNWATGRGALFEDSLWLVSSGSPLRKLIGFGPGTLHRVLGQNLSAAPYALADAIGAHNEYLDLLFSCGILGLVVWLGVLVSHLRPVLRQGGQSPLTGWALGACAYAGQAFFNNRVCSVFPLLVVLLALLRCGQKAASPAPLSCRDTAGCTAAAILLLALCAVLAPYPLALLYQ